MVFAGVAGPAITEAAVGAGVTSLLFFLTLRKINALKGMERDEE